MKKRPLIFVVIALAHLVEPLIKAALIDSIPHLTTARDFFEFWLLYPIAGLALYGVKKWSYPIFVISQLYSLYTLMSGRSYICPYETQIPISFILLSINIIIICYFSLPQVRRLFFDRSLRWWESKQRYVIDTPVHFTLKGQTQQHTCQILNISQSGLFMNYSGSLNIGQVIYLKIKYLDEELLIKGVVKSQHAYAGQAGHGVMFKFNNIWDELYMRKVIKQMKKHHRKARD